MRSCAQCPAKVKVVRVIIMGATTWREHQCLGPEKHKYVTRQDLANEREYRRIRAKDVSARREIRTCDSPSRCDLLQILEAARVEEHARGVRLAEAKWFEPIVIVWWVQHVIRNLRRWRWQRKRAPNAETLRS